MDRHFFSINPSEISKICEKSPLTLVQKGVLFEILSQCWTSDTPGKSGKTISEFSSLLEVGESEVRDLITTLADTKWVAEELCLDSFNAYVNSPKLAEQYAQYEAWVEKSNAETRSQKAERQLAEQSLVSLIKQDADPQSSISIGYLTLEDRKMGSFSGWLPTKRFNGNGQVFYVTEEFLIDLKAEFKDVEVDKAILDIHTWLMRNPTKRKTFAQMPSFISYWLGNSKKIGQGSDVVDFSEIDKMFG